MARAMKAAGAPLGPDSKLWAVAGDPRSLLPGSAAGILQLMHPGLGAGVLGHSDFFDDPLGRIYRSVPLIWRSIFSDDAEGTDVGRRIRDFHPEIKGVDDQGRKYHALDPDTYWWAHATFTWEMFRAADLFLPGILRGAAREQLYAETVTWYRRYGVSERPVPPDLASFEARFDEICRTELEMNDAVRWVLDPGANPAATARGPKLPGLFAPLSSLAGKGLNDVLRLTVYGSMPDIVRRRFDLPWSNLDRLRFAHLAATLQAATPAVKRGALSGMWPEGTPHLEPGSRDRIVVAGPSWTQRRMAAEAKRRAEESSEPRSA